VTKKSFISDFFTICGIFVLKNGEKRYKVWGRDKKNSEIEEE